MNRHDQPPTSPRRYALGHSDRELERLRAQATLINPITQQFLEQAGIAAGMHVLDVGSGVGDVSFLVADLVGETGEVVGVDRAPQALAAARARAVVQSRHNVFFREGDPAEMVFDRRFDVVVGRYVLQFQDDPAGMLRRLALHVRPGGSIMFHEIDWDGVRSFPPLPTYDRCCRWIVDTVRSLGAETRMGVKLHAAFLAAGLPAPTMQLKAVVGGPRLDHVHLITDLIETLLPDIERHGIASIAEVGLETLAERIHAEALAHNSVLIARSEIGAWATV
jgi:2-polyprenyl-3-methyl-5-hydroxy-6-metoxy-1,4-benzoquinol methylase